MAAYSGDQLHTLIPEFFCQGLRNISLLTEELTLDELGHFAESLALINIAQCHEETDQLSSVINDDDAV